MLKSLVRVSAAMLFFAMATIVAGAATSPSSGSDGQASCASREPLVAIAACTAIIDDIAVAKADNAKAHAMRALALTSRAYSEDAQSIEDWGICNSSQSTASFDACTRIIDNRTESDSRRADALYHRSKQHLAAGRKVESMTDFQRALKSFGDHQANSRERAVADYTEALSFDAGKSNWLAERGQLYLSLDNFKAAKADFEKALSLNGKEGIALLGRAFMRDMKGDKRGALRDLKTIVALPTDSDAAKWLNQTATDLLSRIGSQ